RRPYDSVAWDSGGQKVGHGEYPLHTPFAKEGSVTMPWARGCTARTSFFRPVRRTRPAEVQQRQAFRAPAGEHAGGGTDIAGRAAAGWRGARATPATAIRFPPARPRSAGRCGGRRASSARNNEAP